MQSNLITPIIMAGGAGTRLWPLSREDMPKQFCDLGFEDTLFQESLKRVQNNMLFRKPIIVCSAKHEILVRMQAEAIDIELGMVICEPFGRNTAAAIALAMVSSDGPENGLYLVTPSDHKIGNSENFQAGIITARQAAMEEKRIVLFGIEPDAVETGYGYIRSGSKIKSSPCMDILEFIEKPELERVEILVQEPNVFWNSGMFFFRKDVFEQEMMLHAPDVLTCVRRVISKSSNINSTVHPDPVAFKRVPNISIDYAVMEKTNATAICELDTSWTDLGSWKAMWESKPCDDAGNVTSGSVVDVGSDRCLISTDGPVVATCGLEDVVVVANRDAVLVCHKDTSQGVKDIVSELKTSASPTVKFHASETRPWGRFESLDRGETHQVKRITVKPGGQLSLQYHFHRSEHWVVVSGIATVTVDEDVQQLGPCQQVFIPQGAIHRLENFTDETVEIIEVQYGTYLGEDDIVRVEDIYDRPANEECEKVA